MCIKVEDETTVYQGRIEMSEIGVAIRKARLAKGMTLEELAGMVGADAGNLSRVERGKQGASQEILAKLFAALGISLSGVIDAATMRSGAENTGIPSSSVPVISWGHITQWMESMQSFKATDAEDWVPCPVQHGPRTFALRVSGESMLCARSPRSFRPGDFIYVDPDRAVVDGALVVAQLAQGGEPMFRQLFTEGGSRYLKALNDAWPDRIVKLGDGDSILGVVIFKGEVL